MKLGIHLIPEHGRPRDMDLIERVKPQVIKIIDPDPQKVADLYKIAPEALFVLRDFPRGDQHDDMLHNPTETGRRHAAETIAQYRTWLARDLALPASERMVWLGINEPAVWLDCSAVVGYTVAFLDGLAAAGLRGGALNLSVGWPANCGEGSPPDWEPYQLVYEAVKRGGHYLVLHEYWDERGPEFNQGWWAERYKACAWDVPIIIGECGLDEFTTAPGVGQQRRGWKAWLTPEQYMAQLVRYDEMVSQDARVVGTCVFTTDFASRDWFTFDTEGLEDLWPGQSISIDPPTPLPTASLPTPDDVTVNAAITNAVTVDAANVRSKPSPSGDIVTTLPSGQRIHLASEPVSADNLIWLPLDSPVQGYIARSAPNGAPIVKLDGIELGRPFPGDFPVTQGFGAHAQDYSRFGLKGHNGIDFGLTHGTTVLAVDDGLVVEVEDDPTGFGLYVKVRHTWGESLYAHLSMQLTGEGQPAVKGKMLGLSGTTGNSIGPHLHFGVRLNPYNCTDGWQGYTDPQPYLE